MSQAGSQFTRATLLATIVTAVLVASSTFLTAAQSSARTSNEAADAQVGVLKEIDVRGLSDERAATLIAGLGVQVGEPLFKSQCERIGDYVRSFDKQLKVAFIRESDKESKAVIIISRAR